MFKPATTYRIQFHKDFNFKSFIEIIPYLEKLGIDTVYASPIFEADPGSTHGYDVVNPHRINPEIGTEEELFEISKKLKAVGINWLQDIVPNHMAFSTRNAWLMDVLTKGAGSSYADFFDIDIAEGKKLMVPFLGDDLEYVIANKDLKIIKKQDEFYLSYGGTNWPLNKSSQLQLKDKTDADLDDVQLVSEIADKQFYRLCNWKETNTNINYRRFFTVNSLICLNIQYAKNFELYHQYIFELVKNGVFQGLRIDHIDGLYDPQGYLNQLRNAVGEEVYIVVEKILERDEKLPPKWKAQGTTGYDFLATVNNLFTNQSTQSHFDNIYQGVTGKQLDPIQLIDEKKRVILFEHMKGELSNLVELFFSLNLVSGEDVEKMGRGQIEQGLAEMMIKMPVYRYYDATFPLDKESRDQLDAILKDVASKPELADVSLLLKKLFSLSPLDHDKMQNENLAKFYQRLMQFTGPLMAKGVEDTVMYTYNRFVGHSEVGDAPDAFGLSLSEFHQKMIDRQLNWSLSLNGSATHDTKRGEDFRARINVLTDLPGEWEAFVSELITVIQKSANLSKQFDRIHNNDFYLLLQTILGALPFPGEDQDDLSSRMDQYIEKALREAKKRSGWAEPNEEYETQLQHFALSLMDEKEECFRLISNLLKRIADYGIVNSLAQVVLKFTCPGIPDIYQGTELWDLSLVDPDNRRPVDYQRRKKYLSDEESLPNLWEKRNSGQIKLWLSCKLIQYRRTRSEIFTDGEFIPLQIKGAYQNHVLAYARKLKESWVIIAIPVGLASIDDQKSPLAFDWLDTQIILPNNAPTGFKNILTGKEDVKDFLQEGILLSQLFTECPLAVIELTKKKVQRGAGILMHITSLNSLYGIGDLGKQANEFVDFLYDTKQQYWQILPLNPTKSGNGHSPYSSNSAYAGNILLIDLEELAELDLLNDADLKAATLPFNEKINFVEVEKRKGSALQKAYQNFVAKAPSILKEDFLKFCYDESHWLNDFSLYTAIKKHYENLEWYNWPEIYKLKNTDSINSFEDTYLNEIEEVKWQQFIFFRQWFKLRAYCKLKGIKLIGDLPFYLDYDAVEIWSDPSLFKLDQKLKPTHIAGVPPDYFNEKGQLWGMPIFNWEAMSADYAWWMSRLKKNLDMFDLLRLDHFRAFSSFWEVPAGDENAINGTWQKGEGANFFKEVQRNFPDLPFIAEDLGEIDDEVENLRDDFKLPGMRVLQFAFGSDLVNSPHTPYNFGHSNCIAYSGTHDNNTISGWYTNEIDDLSKQRVAFYLGEQISDINIHQAILKLVYSSVANIAILPMQDILGLGEEARMNIPGAAEGNWLWRLDHSNLLPVKAWLRKLTEMYGRVE